LFLEEFIECIELRNKKDRLLCDVCKKKFAFHRRKNAISFASSNPLQPPTSSNNTSVGTAVVRAAANVLPALSYSSSSSSNTSCLDFTTVLPAPLSPSNTQLNGIGLIALLLIFFFVYDLGTLYPLDRPSDNVVC